MKTLGLSPAAFLRDHWQKRPLLVRNAIPGFRGIVTRDALLRLATRADATSRLIVEHPRRRARWERHDGPFAGLDASMLPKTHWTLLVHGVESLLPGGWELLRQFSFIPSARIDDLMISYAAPSGSVGPHDDQYDVFLLQGPGRRRWQVSAGGDRRVDPKAAIKVLANFVAEDEWVLEPGDMLYLPPGVAHWGVAEGGDCFTYSVGFLAPSHHDLVQSFLGYLQHTLPAAIDPALLYEDPDLRAPRDPLELPAAMLAKVTKVLRTIRWDEAEIPEFLGRLLTTPKAQARFQPTARAADLGRGQLRLALPSRGLVRKPHIFLNGQAYPARRAALAAFRELVHARALDLPCAIDKSLLQEWHAAGYVTIR